MRLFNRFECESKRRGATSILDRKSPGCDFLVEPSDCLNLPDPASHVPRSLTEPVLESNLDDPAQSRARKLKSALAKRDPGRDG